MCFKPKLACASEGQVLESAHLPRVLLKGDPATGGYAQLGLLQYRGSCSSSTRRGWCQFGRLPNSSCTSPQPGAQVIWCRRFVSPCAAAPTAVPTAVPTKMPTAVPVAMKSPPPPPPPAYVRMPNGGQQDEQVCGVSTQRSPTVLPLTQRTCIEHGRRTNFSDSKGSSHCQQGAQLHMAVCTSSARRLRVWLPVVAVPVLLLSGASAQRLPRAAPGTQPVTCTAAGALSRATQRTIFQDAGQQARHRRRSRLWWALRPSQRHWQCASDRTAAWWHRNHQERGHNFSVPEHAPARPRQHVMSTK